MSPFRRSLGRLTVTSRWLYCLGIATLNILHDSPPSYLCDLFIRSAPSVRPSRHLSTAVPHFRTSTFRNSVYLSAMYFWHSLPDPVRSSPTIGILEGRLFGHLFSLDNDFNASGPLWVLVWSGLHGALPLLRYDVTTIMRRVVCSILDYFFYAYLFRSR